MLTWIAAAGAGLLAGAGHVVAGPDHLAAVAPLSVTARRNPWRVGLMWGLGHSGGVWLLAVLAVLLREALPIEALSTWGERAVGIVLIGLGLWGWQRLIAGGIRRTPLEPGAQPRTRAALGIGALHGLAGTAHLLGVLPALLLPSRAAAVAYVLAFGLGSIGAMTVFAWSLGQMATRLGDRRPTALRWLAGVSHSAAILVGIAWCRLTFAH